jgi:hypothetical protein
LSICCRAIPPQPGDSRAFSDVCMVRPNVQIEHRSFRCHRDAPSAISLSTFCFFGGLPSSFPHTVLSSRTSWATPAPSWESSGWFRCTIEVRVRRRLALERRICCRQSSAYLRCCCKAGLLGVEMTVINRQPMLSFSPRQFGALLSLRVTASVWKLLSPHVDS